MRSMFAFFKKELLQDFRGGKLIFIMLLFLAFGIMNPAIAKLTPWLLEMLSEEIADSGMTITAVTVDALTSWTQFFKNIPLALIAFVFLYGGTFTKEYETGTLVLVLTKGLPRYKVVLSKTAVMLSVYTLGYFLCFLVTYGYNAYFWDNGIAKGLFPAVLAFWLFGILVLSLTILFSVLVKSFGAVLLCTGGCVIFFYLLGFIPKINSFSPAVLLDSMPLLLGQTSLRDCMEAFILTAMLSCLCLVVSIPLFNKKQL